MPNPEKTYQPAWQRLVIGYPDKPRTVWAPNGALAEEHAFLLFELESLGIEFHFATGSLKGNNILKNALRHAANRYFFQIDIQNAYGQVDVRLLALKLSQKGLHGMVDDIANRLEQICVSPDSKGLAMGGSAAPLLFNTYCLDLDEDLGTYCTEQGLTYTRYLDDLTFSSPDSGFPTRDAVGLDKRRAIREIIAGHKLSLNEHKTRLRDIAEGPVKVTGVQINSRGKVQLPTSYLRAARLKLRELVLTSTDPQEALNYAAGLNGLMNVVNDPERSMSEEEKALFLEAQDVILTYGSGLPGGW